MNATSASSHCKRITMFDGGGERSKRDDDKLEEALGHKPATNSGGKQHVPAKQDKPQPEKAADVIRLRGRRSRSSTPYSAAYTMISFRLPLNLIEFLKGEVPNLSDYCRKVIFDSVERLPNYQRIEEFRLSVEVERLIEELGSLHRWQNAVLTHGSYAEAYLKKLKGGQVNDFKPHWQREPPPEVKADEKRLVEKVVALREVYAHELAEKVARLVELKTISQSHGHVNPELEGGENKNGENT